MGKINLFIFVFLIFLIFQVSAYVSEENRTADLPRYGGEIMQREFVIDAPWKISDSEIPIYFEVRGAVGSFNFSFYGVNFYDGTTGKNVLNISCINLGLPIYSYFNGKPYCLINQDVWKTTKYISLDYFYKDFDSNINFSGVYEKISSNFVSPDNEETLIVNVVDSNFKLEDYYCGDVHYHSKYTDTNFIVGYGEFGASIDDTDKVADAIGLDWFIVTDHSNSFAQHKNDSLNWETFKSNCNSYGKCLVGEEVNCNYVSLTSGGNHILAYNINNLIVDNFSSLGYPTLNNPSCEQIINTINNQGFSYVAHPESDYDKVFGTIKIINKFEDYNSDFRGLQIWNGDIDNVNNRLALDDGKEKWQEILLEGREVFISAGSDAHGDFQDFGKEVTCCYADSYSKSNIFSALENGNCYLGNNGGLTFEATPFHLSSGKLGETISACGKLSLNLSFEYNLKNSCILSVYEGNLISKKEKRIYNGEISGEENLEIQVNSFSSEKIYYRAECLGENNQRVYTNPIWVEVNNQDKDGDGYCVLADCDDNNFNRNFGNEEICDDGSDNDCDGAVDMSDADCSESCSCSSWENAGCGISGCNVNQIFQMRKCFGNCDEESRCVSSSESVGFCKNFKEISITEKSGNNLINYSVEINLSWFAGINSDFSNIYFSDLNSNYSFFVNSWVENSSAKVFVRIPFLESSSTKKIYVSYDNSFSKSNPYLTFLYYDDFTDGDFVDNPSWTKSGSGDVSVFSNQVRLIGSSAICFDVKKYLDIRAIVDMSKSSNFWIGFGLDLTPIDELGSRGTFGGINDLGKSAVYRGNKNSFLDFTNSGTYDFRVSSNGTSILFYNDNYKIDVINSFSSAGNYFCIQERDAGVVGIVDNIKILEYVAKEPEIKISSI